VDGTRIGKETPVSPDESGGSTMPPTLAIVLDPPSKPADPGGPWTTRTIADDEVTDLPSESTEREIGPAGEPLLALARAVDALLAAGLVAQARPLMRQMIVSLEAGRMTHAWPDPTLRAHERGSAR
jgi:hypothetical protein